METNSLSGPDIIPPLGYSGVIAIRVIDKITHTAAKRSHLRKILSVMKKRNKEIIKNARKI
jgi:hypothetical protein